MSSNYTLTIKKLPKRRDCYSAKKKKNVEIVKDNQNSQVADIKKITFEFSPHLISFGFHFSKIK